MQDSPVTWVEMLLAVRVFGPDVLRTGRRLLTAGVRMGISDITTGTPREVDPDDRCHEVDR
ncbi:hypothetical protein ACWGHM_39630 [Streptomyces sp. NPDC054904]|uniref:hypothetical protein n=1 Tax=Streptomyces sp. NPDC090054 TaxID=3365933 RepID=UPI0037F75470